MHGHGHRWAQAYWCACNPSLQPEHEECKTRALHYPDSLPFVTHGARRHAHTRHIHTSTQAPIYVSSMAQSSVVLRRAHGQPGDYCVYIGLECARCAAIIHAHTYGERPNTERNDPGAWRCIAVWHHHISVRGSTRLCASIETIHMKRLSPIECVSGVLMPDVVKRVACKRSSIERHFFFSSFLPSAVLCCSVLTLRVCVG